MFTHNPVRSTSASSATSSASPSSTDSTKPATIILPPELSKLNVAHGKGLYAGLDSEHKARLAVVNAFARSTSKLLNTYRVIRIVGFGSNGAVLAATTADCGPVAIKIIYKARASAISASYSKPQSLHQRVPSEIEVIKEFGAPEYSEESNLLRYVDDWQDENHFYLVTELFGSDWLAAVADSAGSSEKLAALKFEVVRNGSSTEVSLGFSAGSSDLWAWAYAHRAHVWEVTHHGHAFLPSVPVKRVVRGVAVALSALHKEGFYHGDVKAENILVQTDSAVRLADFGHAHHVSFGINSYGTQEMSPPEFLRDSPFSSEELDGRAADVFALGMVLFTLLTESGNLPRKVKDVKLGRIGYKALLSADSGFYPFDRLNDVNAEGIALLDGMCMIDPTRRLTIEQVLAHPWLVE
ncbi:hypothetical protein HDU84_005467 [Entophlyctis sp. JEL0112]|nr:hypothetical protein HDU84_005467 [Entophlyctis sp. JEL0112]